MINKSNIIEYATKKERQLLWFIENFISVSMEPEDFGGYEEVACFPVDLLRKEETGLFPLGRYSSGVSFRSEDAEYGYYCTEMLEKIEKDIYLLRNEGFFSGEDKFAWQEDPGFWIHRYVIIMSCNNIPILEAYLKYLTKKIASRIKNNDSSIKKIEVLEDKDKRKRITIYINGDYNNPRSFLRGKNWSKIYELAESQEVVFHKAFFDYFNYSSLNPLYGKDGFEITAILKEEGGFIVPNIEIKLTTQNKVTRQLKSA